MHTSIKYNVLFDRDPSETTVTFVGNGFKCK